MATGKKIAWKLNISGLIAILLLIIASGCTPAKEILLYPESTGFTVSREVVNQNLANKEAIITFVTNDRSVGYNLVVKKDTLVWSETKKGEFRRDTIDQIKSISFQKRSSNTITAFFFGAVVGGTLGATYHARHYDNQEATILVGTVSSLVVGFGSFRLVSERNKRTRYVIIHEQ